MELVVEPRTVGRFLLWIVVFLFAAHLLGQFSALYLGHRSVFGLVKMFDLNGEWNFPAVFSGGLLLGCSVILALIGRETPSAEGSFRRHWQVLAGIFLFLSADELMSFHDRLQAPLASHFHLSGYWYAGWTVPYAIALVVFLIAYRNFIFHLPRRYLVLFVTAGIIYVAGAMGIETLGAQYLYSIGGLAVSDRGALWVVYYTLEEIAEMVGLVLFIYALLSYICSELGGLRLALIADPHRSESLVTPPHEHELR